MSFNNDIPRPPRYGLIASLAGAGVLLIGALGWYVQSDTPNATPTAQVSAAQSATSSIFHTRSEAAESELSNSDPRLSSGARPAATVPPAAAADFDPKGFGTAYRRSSTPEFAAFAHWTDRYAAASGQPDQRHLVEAGVRLAEERKPVLRSLIRSNPVAALAAAVPMSVRENLPAAVEAALEERVSGTGRLSVLAVLPIPGKSKPDRSVIRSVSLAGREYHAYVPEAVAKLPTIADFPVDGISVDQDLAVAETPEGHAFDGHAYGDSSQGTDTVTGKPSPSWTRGPKKILMIRVDYSDLPGAPVIAGTSTAITNAVGAGLFTDPNGIADFFAACSYNQASLVMSQSDVSPVYRLPQTASYYAQGNGSYSYSGSIRNDALALASANYNLSQYDRIGVVTSDLSQVPGSKVGFAGVAEIDGRNFLINGFYKFYVVAHELAHTFGIYHANWWKPMNGTSIGTEAEMLLNIYNGADGNVNIEYGDDYDIMGGTETGTNAQDYRYQLNPWFRSVLSWLPNTGVQNIQTSGTYRVYRFDHPAADVVNHAVALKFSRDLLREYWISYRKQPYPGATNINNGAYIQFAPFVNRAPALIACNNPGVNVKSAALEVGQSLVDSAAGITITTVAQGGAAPNEYLDVQVTFQSRLAFQISSVDVENNAGAVTMLVDRQGSSTGTTSVDYTTVDDTGISGIHYAGGSGTLTWDPGDTAPKTLSFPILPYPVTDSVATFTVQLSNPTNGVVINPGSITASIRPPGNPSPSYIPDLMSAGPASIDFQPDGKILLGGYFVRIGMGPEYTYVANRLGRIFPDGSRDYSFDSSAGVSDTVSVIRCQPDGKIMIGGRFPNINNSSPARPYIGRLNSDGSTDTTFTTPTLDAEVLDLVVQPDGRIVVAGMFRNVNGQPALGLCRLMPDGTVDFLFKPTNYYFPHGFGGMRSLALDSYANGNGNGVRIIAGGNIADSSSVYIYPKSGIVRLNANGSLDPTFSIGSGAHARGTVSRAEEVDAVAVLPDGRILVGGQFTAFGLGNQKYLVRLNTDGTPDATFAPGIVSQLSFPGVLKIFTQSDGKVIIGGRFNKVNGALAPYFARMQPDGQADPTWDNGLNANNGLPYSPTSLLQRPDGKLFLSMGSTYYAPTTQTFRGLVAPFLNNGIGAGYSTFLFYSGITAVPGQVHLGSAIASMAPGASLPLTVQRINGSAGAIKVDYATQARTGVAGTDFVVTQGTLNWADGDTSAKTINVTCPAGATIGSTFSVNLGIPSSGVQMVTPATTTITISNTTGFAAFPVSSPVSGSTKSTSSSSRYSTR